MLYLDLGRGGEGSGGVGRERWGGEGKGGESELELAGDRQRLPLK